MENSHAFVFVHYVDIVFVKRGISPILVNLLLRYMNFEKSIQCEESQFDSKLVTDLRSFSVYFSDD